MPTTTGCILVYLYVYLSPPHPSRKQKKKKKKKKRKKKKRKKIYMNTGPRDTPEQPLQSILYTSTYHTPPPSTPPPTPDLCTFIFLCA